MNEGERDSETQPEPDPELQPAPEPAPSQSQSLSPAARRTRTMALVGAAAAVALSFGGYVAWRHSTTHAQVQSAMPASTFLAISLDLKLLRGAEWFSRLTENDAGKLVGLANLKSLCGYDATSYVDSIDVAIPEKGGHGDFGVVMQAKEHPLDDEALVACAKKLATMHSSPAAPGAAPAQPVVQERDGFSILQQDGTARFAMRPGGPYLTGRGAWLEAMVDSASGKAPSLDSSTEHASLRRAAVKALPDTSPAAIVVSTLLPPDVRASVRAEMAGETDATSVAAMDGVLGVSGVGLALGTRGPEVRLPDGGVDLTAELADVALELHCESAQACAEVVSLIEHKRDSFSGDIRVRMLGLETAVESIVAAADGNAVHVSLHFNPERVVKALARFGFGGRPQAPPAPPPPMHPLPGAALPSAPPPSSGAAGGGGFAGDDPNPSPFGAPSTPSPPASASTKPPAH